MLVVSSEYKAGMRIMESVTRAFPSAERQAFLDPLLAVRHNQGWNADLVVCEYLLPIIDGIQLIKLLRQQNRDIVSVLLESDRGHSRDAGNLDIALLPDAEPLALRSAWEKETEATR